MEITVQTICAINTDISDYLKWNKVLEEFNSINLDFKFSHLLISSSVDLDHEINNTSFIKTHAASFWAESILLGIEKINHDTDYVLIFNHDSEPNFEGISSALNKLKKMPDMVVGTIINKESGDIIFGSVKEESFLKFEVLKKGENVSKAVCAHGNFLCISKKILDEISIPKFSHTFLDFFVSSYIIKNKREWFLSYPHVGTTNEDRSFRRKKLKASTGIFKPSRSNLKDNYNFYKTYKSFFVAVLLCIYHVFKSLMSIRLQKKPSL